MIQYDFTDMLLKYASRRKRHFNSMILDGCEGTVLQRPVMNKLHWYKVKWLGKGCYIVLEHSEKREGRKDGIIIDTSFSGNHHHAAHPSANWQLFVLKVEVNYLCKPPVWADNAWFPHNLSTTS